MLGERARVGVLQHTSSRTRTSKRSTRGRLENARYVEEYAILVIRLGHTLGLGTNIAMKLMRR